MTSHLKKGEIIADVTAPLGLSSSKSQHAPDKMLIRARVPDGWKVISARTGDKTLPVDAKGTADITGVQGKFRLLFKVQR
jgi:hypothetical protein